MQGSVDAVTAPEHTAAYTRLLAEQDARYAQRMTTTATGKKNPALWILLVLGSIMTLVGLAGTFASKGAVEAAAKHKGFQDSLLSTMEGHSLAYADRVQAAVTPDYTGTWVFVVVGAIGILMLVGALIVKAARG